MTRRRVLAIGAALPFMRLGAAEAAVPEWPSKLEEIRIKHGLPALCGAIVTSEGLQSQAVTGVRKAGEKTAANVEDLWHLGSNTKAMTSTLAACAVEAGKLKWDSTLGDVFPHERDLQNSPLAKATLTHLLGHWSGLPANPAWGLAALGGKDMRSQRRAVLKMATELKHLPAPGTTHLYSNWGYALAGHMLEEVGKADWEELMRIDVFERLGMKRAGFGGTGTPGKIDQPWPHGADGQPMKSNGPGTDNVPALGPAGTVHMSLSDWALFIADHLAGRAGKGKLLKTKGAYEHLHKPTQSGSEYAFGWLALERGWGGKVLSHSGSNTMNFSVAWLAPEKGFAVMACTNCGSQHAPKALDEVAALLIQTQA